LVQMHSWQLRLRLQHWRHCEYCPGCPWCDLVLLLASGTVVLEKQWNAFVGIKMGAALVTARLIDFSLLHTATAATLYYVVLVLHTHVFTRTDFLALSG
jgi:hypothetical protein